MIIEEKYLRKLDLRIVPDLLGPYFCLLVLLIIKFHVLPDCHFLKDFLPQEITHRYVGWHFLLEVQKYA